MPVWDASAPTHAAREGFPNSAAALRRFLPLTFNDLRHFFASALIHAGCSVKQVQAALGHKSAKVTLDVYAHLGPGEEDKVRDAIARLFRPAEARDARG